LKTDNSSSYSRSKPEDLDDIVREVALSTLDKKAESVVILDLRKISDATDYFVMASGDTDIQTRAIADHVIEMMKQKKDLKPWHVEGYRYGNWILLDYVDFVLHVFEKSTREYYQLERLWGDAAVIEFDQEKKRGFVEGET
jgi:ribosome-associated protein